MKINGTVLAVKENKEKNFWSFSIYVPELRKQVWVNSFSKKPDFVFEAAEVECEIVRNSKGFWNLSSIKKVERVSQGDVDRQRLIVRQSCLKGAIDFFSNQKTRVEFSVEDVLKLANEFEDWVFRN